MRPVAVTVAVARLAAVAAAAVLALPTVALAATAEPPAADRLLVRFEAGADGRERAAAAATVDGELSSGPVPGIRVVDLAAGVDPVAAAAELADDPAVRWAQPDWIVRAARTPDDPYFSGTWGLARVGAQAAWDVSTGTPGVTVAVVDSGVDPTHPDLAPNVAPGWDWVEDDADPSDPHGHGTHVAGTIGARGDDGVGVAGVAWGSRLMPLRVLDGTGAGFSSDIAAAFEYAGERGVRVVNASLGGSGRDRATEAAIARHPETLYVVAAGNAGGDNDAAPVYPCAYPLPNVICVAATTEADELAPFSNVGATTVHLAAPGSGVVSTFPGGTWARMSGTSMAAPHVAGAAALLLSHRPDLTAAGVRAALLDGADRLPALAGRTVSGARLNVGRAVGATAHAPSAQVGAVTVDGGTARLTGVVDGRGKAATWSIEYGTSQAYGAATAPQAVDGSAQGVAATLTGLASGTTYHWRLRTTTAGGTAVSADGRFVTAAAAGATDRPAARRTPRRAPRAQIADPGCGLVARRTRRARCTRVAHSVAAWSTLRGVVREGADAATRTSVQVNVVRRAADGCHAYDGRRFRALPCARADRVWVDARRAGATWRVAVRGLQPGRHVFRARTVQPDVSGPLVGDVERRVVRLR